MVIQLHSWPRSSGTRISWVLEELAVPYDYVALDAGKGENLSARHLALHPMGKVPALVDGGCSFFESGAIILHLGDTYGVSRRLWPAPGSQEHADAMSWTVWAFVELGAHMMQYLYHGADTPVSYDPADRSRAAGDYSLSQFQRCLDALETRLAKREYMLGDFTLVDVACSGGLIFGTSLGISLGDHPRVAAWKQRCAERPALKRAR
ncbi:glutathione S-transferase family protein [Taklimakanibacter lacteus]|uniref:glutathione S-transferase family protein n=1 Tax=Taklimakanibacter lacteus TaxID=2268456 RepID=UPI000E66ED90